MHEIWNLYPSPIYLNSPPPLSRPTVSLWPLRLPYDRWLTACAWYYCYDPQLHTVMHTRTDTGLFNTLCIVCTEDPWENAAKKALSLNMFDVFYRSSHLKQKITNKESHSRQREINALKSNVKLVSKTIIKHNLILQVVSERVNNFTAWRLMRRPGPELVHLQSDQISFYKKPIDTKYELWINLKNMNLWPKSNSKYKKALKMRQIQFQSKKVI